ncbi:MAG TPA: hypothetical protein VF861_12995 [Telluria sp.]
MKEMISGPDRVVVWFDQHNNIAVPLSLQPDCLCHGHWSVRHRTFPVIHFSKFEKKGHLATALCVGVQIAGTYLIKLGPFA